MATWQLALAATALSGELSERVRLGDLSYRGKKRKRHLVFSSPYPILVLFLLSLPSSEYSHSCPPPQLSVCLRQMSEDNFYHRRPLPMYSH